MFIYMYWISGLCFCSSLCHISKLVVMSFYGNTLYLMYTYYTYFIHWSHAGEKMNHVMFFILSCLWPAPCVAQSQNKFILGHKANGHLTNNCVWRLSWNFSVQNHGHLKKPIYLSTNRIEHTKQYMF